MQYITRFAYFFWLRNFMEGNMATHQKRKIVETICIICGPISMGIYLELVGPAMKDFKRNVSANYEEFARVLVARSVGYFIGSVIGGFLCDKYVHQMELFLSLAYLFGAVGTGVAPWCQSLALLAVFFHLQGLGQGAIDICNNTLIAKLWQKKAAAPLTALHFAFGIGALTSPFLARPFLSVAVENAGYGNISDVLLQNTTFNEIESFNESLSGGYEQNLVPPYSISAVLTFMFCTVFLLFYLTGRKMRQAVKPEDAKDPEFHARNQQHAKSLKEIFSPGTCVGGDWLYGLQMFLLILFFYLNIVGGERAYGKFLFSFATDSDIKFDNTQATLLNAVFWLCFMIGRGAAIIPAHFIPPHILLFVELMGNVVVTIVLAVCANSIPNVLWVFSGAMGFFLSPVFPAGLAWINLYVELRGMAMAVIFLGAALGGMVYQYLTGYMFEYHGPKSLMYIMVGYAILLTLCFVIMFCICRRHGQREIGADKDDTDEQGADQVIPLKEKL